MIKLVVLSLALASAQALVCPDATEAQKQKELFSYKPIPYNDEPWCYRVKIPLGREAQLFDAADGGCFDNEVVVNTFDELMAIRTQFSDNKALHIKNAWVYAEKCPDTDYYCFEGETVGTLARPDQPASSKNKMVKYNKNRCLEWWYDRRQRYGKLKASKCDGECPLVCKKICPEGQRVLDDGVTCVCPDTFVMNESKECECPETYVLDPTGTICIRGSPDAGECEIGDIQGCVSACFDAAANPDGGDNGGDIPSGGDDNGGGIPGGVSGDIPDDFP